MLEAAETVDVSRVSAVDAARTTKIDKVFEVVRM
jgi:hypothetical protein